MGKVLKRFVGRFLKFTLYFLVITVACVVLYRFFHPPITPLMVIRYFESDSKTRSINYVWKKYEDISEDLALAIVAAEDQKFFDHSGFDVEAIQDAVYENKDRKKIRGASTISQQVAKNLFLWPSRTWLRKGLEAYFTFLVELFCDKKRILELYLNVAEMGDGIYGAETASRVYFNKPAKSLSRGEAALIAAVLPNPKRMSPVKPSAHVSKRQRWIIQQMSNLGSFEFLSQKR